MPKKKGNKLPKGARQNGREKMQAENRSVVSSPVKDTTGDTADVVEQVEATAPVALPVQELPAAEKAVEPAETAKVDQPAERKKPGRKPMTEEQKAEARKQREALKAAAANAKTTVYIQYKGKEDGVDDLVEAARADYRVAHKRKPINSIKIYVKPEEYAAYYVVNDSYFGKVDM